MIVVFKNMTLEESNISHVSLDELLARFHALDKARQELVNAAATERRSTHAMGPYEIHPQFKAYFETGGNCQKVKNGQNLPVPSRSPKIMQKKKPGLQKQRTLVPENNGRKKLKPRTMAKEGHGHADLNGSFMPSNTKKKIMHHNSATDIPLQPSKQKKNSVRHKSAGHLFPSQADDHDTNKKTRRGAISPNCAQNGTTDSIQYDLLELLQQYIMDKKLQGTKSKSSVRTQTHSAIELVTTETQTCKEIVQDPGENQSNLSSICDFTHELRTARDILIKIKNPDNQSLEKEQLIDSFHSSLETNIRQLSNCIKNIESVPSRCDILKNKLKISKKSFMEKENEVLELQRENLILKNKVADITKKFEDSTRLIKDSDKVCFELQQTISRLKMEVMKLKETSKVVAASDKNLKQSTADNEIVNMKLRINNLYAALKQKNVALNEQSLNLNQILNLNKELQQKLFRAETMNLNKTSILNTYKERAQASQKQLSETKDALKTIKDSKTSLQTRLSKLEINLQRTQGRVKHFDMSTQCNIPANDKSITCLDMREICCQTDLDCSPQFETQVEEYRAKCTEIQEWLVKSESKTYQYEVTIQQFLSKLASRKEEQQQYESKSKYNVKNEAAYSACELLELTPAEIAQLYETNKAYDNVANKSTSVLVNEWMITIRNITRCPIFCDALSGYLYKIITQCIKIYT